MLNPFGPQRESGLSDYANLQKRVLQRVKAAKVSDQIFQVVQNAFEEAVSHERNFVLSRSHRMRMFSQILRSVLEEMVQRLDNSTKSNS